MSTTQKPRRKRGRPPVPNPLSHRVSLRLTSAEMARVEELAGNEGRTVSECLRGVVTERLNAQQGGHHG